MRRVERYPLALRVELEHGTGVTRDVSTRGVYFECDGGIAPGTTIRFDIMLDDAGAQGAVRLRCSGQVIRVEERSGKIGVAASMTAYTIEGA